MTHIQPELETSKGPEGGFLSGLLMGGLIGAATGLLLAPRSGMKTRVLLHNKGMAVRNQMTHTVEDARTRAGTLVEETAAKAEALQQRSQEFIEAQKERLEKTAEAALQAAQTTWTNTAEKEPVTQ